MKILFCISLSLISASAFAAGSEGHHPSASDLIFPAINFVILASFLGWKLKGVMKTTFNEQAEEVKKLYDYAEEKDKEAQLKLSMFEKKMSEVESSYTKILSEADTAADKYSTDMEFERKDKIQKLHKESDDKLDYEKNLMVEALNKTLLNQVIGKAKESIGKDGQKQKLATKKILSRL